MVRWLLSLHYHLAIIKFKLQEQAWKSLSTPNCRDIFNTMYYITFYLSSIFLVTCRFENGPYCQIRRTIRFWTKKFTNFPDMISVTSFLHIQHFSSVITDQADGRKQKFTNRNRAFIWIRVLNTQVTADSCNSSYRLTLWHQLVTSELQMHVQTTKIVNQKLRALGKILAWSLQ